MRVLLKITTGLSVGKKILLWESSRVDVGRTEQADFVVASDPGISSRHFSLHCLHGVCTIQDLISTNGTFVNGARITDAKLQNGDRIVAGETTFQVNIEATASVPPPAAERPNPLVAERPGPSPSPPSRPLTPSAKAVPSLWDLGTTDPDPGVRRAALLAAAWTRQSWLLEYCRAAARSLAADSQTALWLLAVLGREDELSRILTIGGNRAFGPMRFTILGTYGHPQVVDALLPAIAVSDLPTAVAAAAAWTKITGIRIDTGARVPLKPAVGPEPDAFESEFLEEVAIPDATLAESHWTKLKSEWSNSTRRAGGLDVSQESDPAVLSQLDLQSRFEACLRGRFWGTWSGTARDLDAFPQNCAG